MPSKLIQKTMRVNRLPHIWCPGCGHGILMRDVCQAIKNCGLEQEKVAIVSGISNPIAMVEAPDGKGYTVRRGTFIGKRSGKVTNIRPSEMVITEIYKDNAGVPQPHEIYIALPKSPEEQMDLEGENNLMNAGIEQ